MISKLNHAKADKGEQSDVPEPARKLPIIGIGASAGGLHALELFFAQVPAHSGAAFVVVQHLDPDKTSLLAELLQRVCVLPVRQVQDQTAIEPDHVYVAPPGQELTLLHGTLHLLKPAAARGLSLPIDFFLRSLAQDQGPLAAGVILSGMGSDGTLGLRALKEKGGGVFVQSPDTANFTAMPRHAVDAELADVVAPAEELPARILAYFAHPLLGQQPANPDGPAGQNLRGALEKILILVRAQTGHDFSAYKKSTVYRRIQRRMAIHQLREVDDYVQFLRANPAEAELLFKELLIGVTSFFRDAAVWQHLRDEIIPKLLAQYPEGATLRAWVPACSTGEEAYTLAMVFSEAVQALQPRARYALQVFATDLDKDAIEKARQGRFADNITADVSPERLDRFFSKVPDGYCISKDIRAMVIFAQQSIAVDPPFAKLHLLSCRNLMIYLESDLQQQLLRLFHSSLLPGGYLVLGSAETVGQASNLFASAGAKTRTYRRVGGVSRPGLAGLPMQGQTVAAGSHTAHALSAGRKADEAVGAAAAAPSLQNMADQVLLRKFAPSAVLVTAEGDIVYFSGKTGKYLEPPAGKANLNLFAMARPSLRQPLFEVFYRAARQKETITLDEVPLNTTPDQAVRITVEPLVEPSRLDGMLMVVFADVNRSPSALQMSPPSDRMHDAQVAELMHELARAREEHQATREEMQTSQEELKSANEELQSANEELTTSREEMQSMNEELQTVNAELQTRVDALARASDDMENLLNSTDIATLFLDAQLHVRRYTTRATGLIKLIPTDVGRPISDLSTDLEMDLAGDSAEVLRTLMFREAEVQASGKRWFRVRTMPYRTQDNRIDGVVITFVDITSIKATEAALRKVNEGKPA